MSARYPFTGPNYAQHGEVAGYIYYPWNDQYYIDPQQVQAYNESVGLAEPVPEEPSLFDTLLPVAGTAGALAVGTGLGQRFTSGEWPSWLGGGNTPPVPVEPTVVPQAANQIAMGGSGGAGSVGALEAASQLGGGSGSAPNVLSVTRSPMQGGSFFDKGGPVNNILGNTGQGLLGGAGLLLGAKGMYDAYQDGSPIGGALSGAGAGAGGLALAGSLGAATGGLALPVIAGAALLGGGLGALGDRETGRELIQKRVEGLQNQGVNIPQPLLNELGTYGLSQDDLVAREQQKIASGQHGNAIFAQTRNVKDLTPQDTVGGLMWLETLGNDYLQGMTPEQRIALNDAALKEGLVTEGRGQLNLTDKERAKQLAQAVKGGMNPQQPTQQGTSNPVPLGMLGEANRMQTQPAPQGPQMPAMLGGLQINPVQQQQQPVMGMMPARTNTLSPGIGLDGRPIRY